MKSIVKLLSAVASIGCIVTITACNSTSARTEGEPVAETVKRSAREIVGASPYQEIKNEGSPKLIVDPPLPDLLDKGVVWIQWRVENVHILPVFNQAATDVSPRLGHLHVQVDDLPWWWADPSNINTIDMAGLPPGPHKVKITLVNPNHEAYEGQSKLVTFTIPEGATMSHSH
jgi:hypothetical protein